MPVLPADPEIIVTCLKRRFTGVSGTISALLPVQARRFALGYVGVDLPGSQAAARESPACFRPLSLWQALALSMRRIGDGRRRIWHVRRNHEMLLAIVLRDLLRLPIRVLFTSAAIRRHSAMPRWLIGRMDGVIATTPAAARCLDQGAPNQVVTIQGHGVDTARFVPPPSRTAAWAASGLPGHYGVGVFGRVRAEKGVHIFVAAMLELLPDFPQWTAVIGGLCQPEDRAFAEQLKAQAAAAGLAERIVWLGEIDAAAMPEWYQRMTVTVACPLYEGYGLTPIEAMASGSAVVATRTGAFADMVEAGASGELVAVGDAPSLAAALRPLLSDPEAAEAMGRVGRERAQRHFSIDSEAAGIAAVYQRLWAAYARGGNIGAGGAEASNAGNGAGKRDLGGGS